MTKRVIKTRIITPDDGFHRVHTYYKGTPCHPDGRRVLCFRFKSLESGGHLCLIDLETGAETELAPAETHSYHSGANAYFCDGGNKVIYREKADATAVLDLNGGEIKRLPGEPCNYCGHVDRHFIQVDSNYPLETQGKMGVYLTAIDGSSKRLLANVDQLLDVHPLGKAIRQAGILFRLGAEISPNQKRVRLGLLTRSGGLLKDFFTCDLDGAPNLEFHGKIGSHPGWSANGRLIYALVKPWQTILGELREFRDDVNPNGGMLGRYDIENRALKILSTDKITGGSHVAPSPLDGDVVLDEYGDGTVSILLHEASIGRVRPIHSETYNPPDYDLREALVRAKDPKEKRYDVSAHPVFSPDGRKIVFNSCADGIIRLKEIEWTASTDEEIEKEK